MTNDYGERAEFPFALIKKMGALGIIGDGIKGYGCPKPVSPALPMDEALSLLERAIEPDSRPVLT